MKKNTSKKQIMSKGEKQTRTGFAFYIGIDLGDKNSDVPPGGRRNRRMGQLMSDAISFASAGRDFPQLCAEVCLDPVSGAQRVSVSLRRCRFPRLPALQNTSCVLLSSPFLTIADPFSASSQHRELSKHIARGILQRLSTTEF